MGKTHVVIPDYHARPGVSNKRAEWIGKLLLDLKPDVVVNIGDLWDMESLCSYDKGKATFAMRNYKKDIEAGCEAQDMLFHQFRKHKKRRPESYCLIGNHEHRITKLLEYESILQGAIGYEDMELDRNWDHVVHYSGGTPGVVEIDGVWYAHYMVSGVMGRPVGGEHHAYSLISKGFGSSTVGHSHLVDYAVRTHRDGAKLHGLVVGCCVGNRMEWAGNCFDLWWQGVVIKRNVEKGQYDPEFVSLSRLQKEYGRK